MYKGLASEKQPQTQLLRAQHLHQASQLRRYHEVGGKVYSRGQEGASI